MTKEAEKTSEKRSTKSIATHIVKKGEKLSDIATKNGLTVRKLANLNKLSNFEIKEGAVLNLS